MSSKVCKYRFNIALSFDRKGSDSGSLIGHELTDDRKVVHVAQVQVDRTSTAPTTQLQGPYGNPKIPSVDCNTTTCPQQGQMTSGVT